MYLYLYDLSLVSDEALKIMLCNEFPRYDITDIEVTRTKYNLIALNRKYNVNVVIDRDGVIEFNSSNEKSQSYNHKENYDALLNTQWIDPKDKLPKDQKTDDDNINYIIKLENGIMKAEYHFPIFYVYDFSGNETLYDRMEIVGYISANNVEW